MAKQTPTILVVKQTDKAGHYDWRPVGTQSRWLASSASGTLEELAQTFPGAQVCLLLESNDVVTRQVAFKPNERKFLNKLVPFELESEIAGNINNIHCAFGGSKGDSKGDSKGNSIPVAYCEKSLLRQRISTLEAAGLEVVRCHSSGQLMTPGTHKLVLALTGSNSDQVEICWQGSGSTNCSLTMLPVVLAPLFEEYPELRSGTVLLAACGSHGLQRLRQSVSSVLTSASEILEDQLADPWDLINLAEESAINLRQGEFSVPVRWQRYWRPMKMPAAAAAAALLIYVVSTVVEIQLNNSRYSNLQTQIEQAYRRAVPQGVLVDAEQQLATQLARPNQDESQTPFLSLLDQVAPVLLSSESLKVDRINFSASQGELQLGVTANTNAEILGFGEKLNSAGLSARAQIISRSGEIQQASLIISGDER